MKKLILFTIFALTLGCQTAPYVRLSHQNYPIGLLTKTVVSSLPGGMRSVSTNRREFSSQYFLTGAEESFDAEKAKVRKYIKVVILGEQRPYEINVIAPIEEKVYGVFTVVDYDDGLALKHLKIIKDKLAQSREDRNVIDDFRPF